MKIVCPNGLFNDPICQTLCTFRLVVTLAQDHCVSVLDHSKLQKLTYFSHFCERKQSTEDFPRLKRALLFFESAAGESSAHVPKIERVHEHYS